MRFLAPVAVALASSGCLIANNPFDPDTPPELQAPGTLRGVVQAVTTPINETTGAACPADAAAADPAACDGENADCCVPAASFCANVDGDHSGFRVNLRGLVAADAADAVFAPSQETGATGEFSFVNVPPGSYALEVVKDGFAVPLPRSIEVAAGADVVLAPLCAIDATPPPAPVVLGLPAVARADDAGAVFFDLTVPGCSSAAAVDVVLSAGDRVVDSDHVVVPGDLPVGGAGDVCAVTVGGDAPDAVEVWELRVVLSDDVGNRSEPSLRSVVVDVAAPAAPVVDVPVVGLDRVSLSWTQPDGATDVDHYLVSYGLVPRPAALACPAADHVVDGVFGDEFDVAAFAIEGPSPVVAPLDRQILSGILPGTELFAQVAAVDVAGNVSCFSDGVAVRPDRTAPRLQDGVAAAAAADTVVESDGVVAYGGALFAVRDRSGALQPVSFDGDGVDVDDVVISGDFAYGAARGLGVVRVAYDSAGVIGVVDDVVSGVDARSLLAIPGGLIVGTADGIAIVDADGATVEQGDPGDVDLAVSRLAQHGELVVAARVDADGNARVLQATVRRDPTTLLGSTARLAGAPDRMVFAGNDLWVVAADVVEVFDTRGCLLGNSDDCLRSRGRFGLADGADATDAVVADDTVVVWSASAGGFVFAKDFTGVPPLIGRAFAPPQTSLTALRLAGTGFCASGAVDDAGARGERCWSFVNDGLPVARAPVASRGAASAVDAAGADDVVFIDSLVDDEGAVDLVAHTVDGDVGQARAPAIVVDDDVALPRGAAGVKDLDHVVSVGTFGVDQYGRLLFLAEGAPADVDFLDVVDDSAVAGGVVAALGAAAPGLLSPLFDDDDDSAVLLDDVRVRVYGDDVWAFVIARGAADVVTGCPQAFAVRYRLAPRGAAALAVVGVDVTALGRAFRITDAVVRHGRAYVGVHPFGVAVVDLADGAVDDDTVLAACDAATNDGTRHADAFPLNALAVVDDRVLATGIAGAGFPARDALIDVTTSTHQVVLSAGARLRAVVAVGPFVALTTLDPASTVLVAPPTSATSTFLPVAALPGVERATALAASRTGVFVADGNNGVARFVVR